MLQPKKTKYRKMQKGRMKGNAQRGHRLSFGTFGIKSLEECWITARQIEAARIAVTRYMKRQGQVWIRIFPSKPITKKPAEVRMGKGKGAPEYWAATVNPGRILFEIDGVDFDIEIEFDKDGDFDMRNITTYTGYSGMYTANVSGEWEFSSDKEEIELDFEDSTPNWEIEITRLTNKEFEGEVSSAGSTSKVRFEAEKK